jgi:hypothetical protein
LRRIFAGRRQGFKAEGRLQLYAQGGNDQLAGLEAPPEEREIDLLLPPATASTAPNSKIVSVNRPTRAGAEKPTGEEPKNEVVNFWLNRIIKNQS